MGGDGSNVKISGALPLSGDQMDFKEDDSLYGGRRVVMDPIGRLPVCIRAMSHQGVHSAAAGHHYVAYYLPVHI